MLKRIKDRFTLMYEKEIIQLKDNEFKALALLRIKGGENSILWYKKDKLQKELGFGRDKLNQVINSLEEKGAVIVLNCKDAKSKKQVSNVYYVAEYDTVNKEYITANSIEEIKEYALELRQNEEKKYATEKGLKPRDFILEERLSSEKRKVKYIKIEDNNNKKPTTENQYMDPTTENQYMDPTTENQYPLYKQQGSKYIKDTKYIKNNNNKKYDETVVVKKIQDIFSSININKNEAIKIYSAAKQNLGLIREKYLLLQKQKEIQNVVGWVIKALKEDYKESKQKNSVDSFNNYQQRSYDYNELEKKLLGWE